MKVSGVLSTFLLVLLAPSPALAGELRGRVLAGGKPAAGVVVSAVPHEAPLDAARREARRGAEPKPALSVTTGADGAFVIALPADAPGHEARAFEVRLEGEKLVSLSLDGLYDASESEDLGDLALAKGKKLAGRVLDRSGAPVPGAEVTLQPGVDPRESEGETTPLPRRAKTDADGTFRLEGASASRNDLIVEKEGLAIARLSNVNPGALPRPVVLEPGVTVTGVVVKSDRKSPAAGALVRIEGKATTRWAEAREDGTFTLAGVPAGTGTLTADGGDAGHAERRGLSFPTSQGRTLTVALSPPGSIEGRAVDAKTGRPVPRVKIELRAGGVARVARTGPDGRYRVRPLPPGAFRFRADEARYVPWTKDDVRLASGEAKKLDVPLTLGATVTGRVVDEAGAPVAAARGAFEKRGETGIRAFVRRMQRAASLAFRSGKDGAFRASRLSPGENQRLRVEHPDFETSTLGGIHLTPGGTTPNVRVVLRQGAAIAGFVHDKDGAPIARAEVTVGSEMTAGRGGRAVTLAGGVGRGRIETGPDGRFEVRGLSPGDYALSIRKAGWAAETFEPVKVVEGKPSAPLDVTFVPGASISGWVRTKSGNGVEGTTVVAGTGTRPPLGRGAFRNDDATGPDGFFVVDGLKAGTTYDLQLFSATGLGPQKKGVAAPADGVEILVKGSGRITGTARDAATSGPLTDFRVTVEPARTGGRGGMAFRFARAASANGNRGDTHVDDGAFVLEDVSAGTWDVVVEAKGYQTGRIGGVVVEEGATRDGIEVKLSKGSLLRGRVTDARSGRPVVEAAVSTSGGENTTDLDGRFEIDGLAPGKYGVTVRHPDYAEATQNVELKETGASVDVHLVTGGVVAGTVFGSDRQALSGAEVSLQTAGESGGFGRFGGGQAATTDGAGRFRFDHLDAGRYSATASLRTSSSAPYEVVLQAGESREDVALTLNAGTTVTGTVSGLPDAQRAGVNVWAAGPEGYSSSTRTSADGRFEIPGVPAGAVVLRATAGDFLGSTRSAQKELTIAEGTPQVETEIVFETGYTLSGRVTKGSDPLPNANVFASQTGGGGRAASTRTDDGGSYRLEGLQAGTYGVTALASDPSGASKRDTVNLTTDQTLDLAIPSARLAGTVVEAGSRQPLADAVVEIAGAGGGPFSRMSTTDANGRFALENLDEKSYTLNARKPDFQFEKRDVTAAEQGSADLLIELTRGEGIGIQARDGIYGVPLHGILARAYDEQRTPVFTGSVALDGDGVGEIPSLKPGRYSLFLDASGYAPQSLDSVTVPSPTIPVAFTPGGTVEIHAGPQTLAKGTASGRILTARGAPYSYSLFSPDGRINLGTPVRRLPNIAPGSYTLALDGGPAKAFQVMEGGVTIVELP